MGVSLALLGLTALFWYLGLRNPDEVIGILEKLMATMLLVLTLSFGGLHLGIGLVLLAVVMAFLLGQGLLNAAAALCVVYVPQYFRVVRNQTAAVKAELFVEAAQSLGAGPLWIMRKYLFRNVITSVPVVLTMNAADSVLMLGSLGFLGLDRWGAAGHAQRLFRRAGGSGLGAADGHRVFPAGGAAGGCDGLSARPRPAQCSSRSMRCLCAPVLPRGAQPNGLSQS